MPNQKAQHVFKIGTLIVEIETDNAVELIDANDGKQHPETGMTLRVTQPGHVQVEGYETPEAAAYVPAQTARTTIYPRDMRQLCTELTNFAKWLVEQADQAGGPGQ